MEFAYDHVLIESSSPAEEIGVHTAAACAESETRSDSSDDEQPKPKPMSGLTNQPPMLICVDEPPDDMDLELTVPPSSLTTPADAVLSVKNLFNVTKEVTNWYTLGLQLDIPTHKLQSIQHDHRTLENSKHEMLHFWVHSDPEASWGKLATAVEKMEFRRISERIRDNYIPLSQCSVPMATSTRGITPLMYARPKSKSKGSKRGPWTHSQRLSSQPAEHDGLVSGHNPPTVSEKSDCPIDTNVLAVKFSLLSEPGHLHTGDAIVCCNEKCGAVLNHLSKLSEEVGKKEKVWMCEFCGTRNEVDVVAEEIPKEEGALFKIAPATPAKTSMARDSLVVFCMDTSGSMCVTTEVSGKFDLKGHERLEHLQKIYAGNGIQRMPRQRWDVTYISRLQSIQAAVDHQLTTLARDNPSQRVAVVTFGDEVTVSGGDRADEMVVTGDRLWKHDALVQIGDTIPLPLPIKQSKAYLTKKVFGLEEDGQTTLGPALLISVQLASQAPGSKVIVCTDGLANRGVGNLDDPKALKSARRFYRELGAAAKSKSVTVSVLTIKGTECGLIELGQVASITGGEVNIVDPMTVVDEFNNILATPIIATGVNIKILLHNDLFFRGGDSEDSVLNVPVGSVKANTELTYEFRVKTTSAKSTAGEDKTNTSQSIPGLMIEGTHHMPFQLQIKYTDSDGAQCMRVLTQARPVTSDRKVAKQGINLKVLSCHFSHKTGRLAVEGNYEGAAHFATSCIRDLEEVESQCQAQCSIGRRRFQQEPIDGRTKECSVTFLQHIRHKAAAFFKRTRSRTEECQQPSISSHSRSSLSIQRSYKMSTAASHLDGYDDIGLFSTDYMDEVGGYENNADTDAEAMFTAYRATWEDIESTARRLETGATFTHTIDLPNKGYGFGFTLEHDESHGSVILSVVPGGIAERDGRLQVGDHIMEINGESVAHLSHSEIVAMVKTLGQGGDPIQLGVVRMEQATLDTSCQISGESATLEARPHLPLLKNLDSTSTESITIELANEGYGFGFSLAAGEDGHSMIKCLIPDGIAERDGRLQVGDQIVEINGERVAHLSHPDMVDKVKALGQGGEPIRLGLARVGIKHVRFSTEV